MVRHDLIYQPFAESSTARHQHPSSYRTSSRTRGTRRRCWLRSGGDSRNAYRRTSRRPRARQSKPPLTAPRSRRRRLSSRPAGQDLPRSRLSPVMRAGLRLPIAVPMSRSAG
jgi:hypothetical protein